MLQLISELTLNYSLTTANVLTQAKQVNVSNHDSDDDLVGEG